MFSDCALGASFVFIAATMAPTHKKQVTIVIGALAVLLGLGRSLYLFVTEDYWGAFTYLCAAVGALLVQELEQVTELIDDPVLHHYSNLLLPYLKAARSDTKDRLILSAAAG